MVEKRRIAFRINHPQQVELLGDALVRFEAAIFGSTARIVGGCSLVLRSFFDLRVMIDGMLDQLDFRLEYGGLISSYNSCPCSGICVARYRRYRSCPRPRAVTARSHYHRSRPSTHGATSPAHRQVLALRTKVVRYWSRISHRSAHGKFQNSRSPPDSSALPKQRACGRLGCCPPIPQTPR